jgi:hypothetical protein
VNLLRKFRETALSVIPIVVIVVILNLTIAPVGWLAVGQFALGAISIIVGLSLFLLGTDIGIVPVGQRTGAALMQRRNLPLLLASGFVIGLIITIAEPQVQVLAQQVALLAPYVSRNLLVLAISLGVGLFVSIAFARIVLAISYRWVLIVFYAVVAILSLLVDSFFLGIAFDAGGATTGPMTVPFILALGVGVAAVRKSGSSEQDSFGLVGIASIGPISAVLVMGLIGKSSVGGAPVGTAVEGATSSMTLGSLIGSSTLEVLQALGPLALLFILFQFTLLHQQRRQLIRMIEGLIYAAIGLILFLTGINGAFMPIGSSIGALIGASSYLWVLIPIGIFLGAVVVLAEPAVWVLTDQVRDVSGGSIRKSLVLVFFSIGVSLAVGLAMVRIVFRLPLSYFLIPGYVLALLLTFRCPPLFTAIAFDSGGVASGPMSSSFLLAFTLGASAASGGDPFADAFGIVALIAMTPLVTIQLLGLLYRTRNTKGRQPALERNATYE